MGVHPNSLRGRYFWGKKSKEHPAISIASVHLGFHGAFAYYLTPMAAAMLVEIHENCLHRADDWAKLLSKTELRAYHAPLFPHPAERGTLAVDRKMLRSTSSIFRRIGKTTFNNLSYRLKCEIIKIYARLFLSPIRGIEGREEENAEA